MPKEIKINENIKKLKEIFPNLDIKKYLNWIKNTKNLIDKDEIIKSFYEQVLEEKYEIENINKNELLKLLEEITFNNNELKQYVEQTKNFIQKPEKIILEAKKEIVDFFSKNLKDINDKIINTNLENIDLNLLEKVIKINEIFLNTNDKKINKQNIEKKFEQIENIFTEKNNIEINLKKDEIKEFNILKHNVIVNYFPEWIIPTLFNPKRILSSLQKLNLSFSVVYYNYYNSNNIFSLLQKIVSLATRIISLFTFIDNSVVNRFLKSLSSIIISTAFVSFLSLYKEKIITKEDLIALVLNAPKNLNLGLPINISAGSLSNIQYQDKTIKSHIIDLINEQEKINFLSYGKIQFFYPFQNFFNKSLSEIIKNLSQQFIVMQFPPKVNNISKQNNYNTITSTSRAEQLFAYGGGSNITTELRLFYVANCLIREEQKNLLNLENKNFKNQLELDKIDFIKTLKNKFEKKYNNLFKIINYFNIDIQNLTNQLQDKYHEDIIKKEELTRENFIIKVLKNINNIEYFNQLNKISVKSWSLIDIYVNYIKFLYLMYPYVDVFQNGKEVYIFPPLIKIKPNQQTLNFIDPPNFNKNTKFKDLNARLTFFNNDKDLSTYYILNSVSIEFAENMYDRNFDLSTQINIILNLTRVEKNVYEYAYNLKNLID